MLQNIVIQIKQADPNKKSLKLMKLRYDFFKQYNGNFKI